jgi:hypothetical protein
MQDPAKGAGLPVAVATATFATRSAIFCQGGGCNFTASDENVAPNRTLHCATIKTMSSLIGFLPSSMYPATIRSTSYYRLEWQRPPAP